MLKNPLFNNDCNILCIEDEVPCPFLQENFVWPSSKAATGQSKNWLQKNSRFPCPTGLKKLMFTPDS